MKTPVFNITQHLLQFSVTSAIYSYKMTSAVLLCTKSPTRISVYSYWMNKEPSLLDTLPSLVNNNMPFYYVSVAFSCTKAVLRGKRDGNYVFSGLLEAHFLEFSDVRTQTDFRTGLQTNGSLSQHRVHQTRTAI
jgi:hypothetical protein